MRPAARLLASLAVGLPLAGLPADASAQPAAPQPGPPRSGPVAGGPGAGPAGAPVPAAPGQIAGVVVDGAEQPIAGAGIAVRGGRDSALVGGAVTRADGGFRIDGLRPGRYTLRVRALGFAPLVRAVAVGAEQPRVELGRVALVAVAAQLSGVQVTAERQEASLAPDRNSYAVRDMPTTSGGTAVDVLRNVPAVEVDGDNKVSLRGNDNVVVQINGRVTPMRGEQLGNYLAQLPANLVARVEVVPNPSAKNDPEGMAGIINIVLKQSTDLGTSGGLAVGGGSTGQLNASGNLGHQQGPWTLFGSYGFMHDRRTVSGWASRQDLLGGSPNSLDSDISAVMIPESHSVTATVEYKAGARHTLGSNLVLNARGFERDNDSFYRTVTPAGAVTGRSDQRTGQDARDLTLDYALTWRRTVDPQKNALVTEARFTRGDGRNDLDFTEALRDAAGAPVAAPPMRERNDADELNDVLFLQTDWTRGLGTNTKLETGYKGTFREMTSDFAVARLATAGAGAGAWQPDLDRSNAFTFREQVNAAYGVLSRHAGRVDLQAGLRLEQADTRFDLRTTRQRFDADYRSVFPSALVSYNVDAARQVKLSYSKRINRPDVRQLNPFGFREDALNQFGGNPALRPEYTHAFELGWQQPLGRGSLQLTPFFRHTVDAVRMFGQLGDDGILRVMPRNVATSDQYGADVNLSLKLGALSGFGGASVFEQRTDAGNLGAVASVAQVRAFGWSTRANVTWKVSPALDVQAFAMYRPSMRTEQGRMSRFTMANVAVRQKLRGDKASVSLRIADPFGTMGWGYRASDGRIVQDMQRRFGARGTFLSFNYTFGKPPRIRQRPAEQQDGGGQPGMPG